jgi:hypothetical protein
LPIRIRGTERVKANAPKTPSIENVASITLRYMILLQSDIMLLRVSRSVLVQEKSSGRKGR